MEAKGKNQIPFWKIPRERMVVLAIGSVWLFNGLYCKILNGVPRHYEIVDSILTLAIGSSIAERYSQNFTYLIGFGEVLLAFLIWSNWRHKTVTWVQIVLIGLMNTIEFVLVPDLLLWGRWNALFALLFMLFLYKFEQSREISRT